MSENTGHASEISTQGLKNDPKRLGRILFGALFLAVFVGYYIAGMDLDKGTLAQPGPGMIPGWIGIAGAAISLLVIVESLLGRSESGRIDFPRGRDLKDVLIFTSMVIVYYAVLIPTLGQYIASALFAVAFIRVVGRASWVKSIIIGVVMGIVLTLFFAEALGIRLPSGMILP
ncbi:tripartite tricarboxylate transporter TctB family protein [Nocardiopsis alba]|uniref:Tripartite tricarboxylate transporter TctB family protein n=2 Tax=Nocardiopsis alba TaxID=53437 RepID=A0ABV5DPA0_9ACTN|nr:tripartite tricarboxylate transporter TctB family protein [Nocardiopsis alba]AFR06900.1 tripartite tricarboxylate transporter TctB family protein [Nocardiopsis alba ATCC BAA-2165]